MARRLLGADSATVFNVQEPEEEATNQVPIPPAPRGSRLPCPLSPPSLRTGLGSALWRAEGGSEERTLSSNQPPSQRLLSTYYAE